MLRPYRSLTIHLFVVLAISTAASSLLGQDVPVLDPPDVITEGQLPNRIAFGSCGHQSKPMPILRQAIEKNPDLFIYLGDNIYGDTKDMEVLAAKYELLNRRPEFQTLRSRVPILSIWDDHDYGWNDAGKEYEFKEESKAIFMDFWRVPKNSPRRAHAGIYGSHRFTKGDKTLQIILLDTRTFRDSLTTNPRNLPKNTPFKNQYQPAENDHTLLGDSQWKWLEETLREPADMRVICTSIQFGHEYNGWESWTNLPRQQQKMIDLVRKTKAKGVMFISGDVHWGEISKRDIEGLYPLYDVTASGLTEEWPNLETNKFRVGEAYRENHFGMIEVDWDQEDPEITLAIVGLDGKQKVSHQVRLSDLR